MSERGNGHAGRQWCGLEALEHRTLLAAAPVASIVADINPGPAGSNPWSFTELNGKLFFIADDGQHGRELWRTDGTAAGTHLVLDAEPEPGGWAGYAVPVGDRIVFSTKSESRSLLWSSDGTAEGTRILHRFVRAAGPIIHGMGTPQAEDRPASIRSIVSTGSLAFVTVDAAVFGVELWRTDGTVEGTYLLSQGLPVAEPLWTVGDKLFFRNISGEYGLELWFSDGTLAGTRLFADIAPGAATSSPGKPTPLDGGYVLNLYGNGVYWTDGTAAGTRRLGSVQMSDGMADRVVEMGGFLYFNGRNSKGEWALWRTDGTAEGTSVVGPVAAELTRVGRDLFYRARTPDDTGYAVWKTDGTPGGTVMLGAIARDIMPGVYGPFWIRASGGLVYAYGNDLGEGIYQSDGTIAGTRKLAEVPAQEFAGSINGRILFTASGGESGLELWQLTPPASSSMRPYVTGPAEVLRSRMFALSLCPAGTAVNSWTINWGDGVIEDATGNMTQVVHRYARTGRYRITVSADIGGSIFRAMAGADREPVLTVAVNNVRPRPSVAAADAVVPGQAMTFAGRTNDGTMRGYFVAWDFGDGGKRRPKFTAATRSALNPSHVYRKAGACTVRMWVRNPAGKVGVVMWKVRVADTVMQRQPDRPGQRALVVGGTAGNDLIQVMHRWGGRMEVVVNGKSRGLFAGDRLIVHAGDGDDMVRVDDLVSQPVELYGDKGWDRLHAAGKGAVLVGELIV